ncbi:ester cyclase [Bacteroidota bacterium]
MAEKENKLLVKRFIEEVINTGNIENIAEFISPGFFETADVKRESTGIEGMKNHVLGVRKVYPDLNITIDRQIAEGDWVATCITARSTHSGEWMGIKPTNKKVEFTGVNIDRVLNGKIVEHGGAANMLQSFLDIGAVTIS